MLRIPSSSGLPLMTLIFLCAGFTFAQVTTTGEIHGSVVDLLKPKLDLPPPGFFGAILDGVIQALD